MASVFTIIDPDGTEWPLDGSQGLWAGPGRKGFHGVTYEHYRSESPAVAGAFWNGVRALPREMIVPIVIRDTSHAALLAKRREFAAAVSPVNGTGECILVSAWPDGSTRRITARYVDGLDAGEQGRGEWGLTVLNYNVRFIADAPYMRGEQVREQWSLTVPSRTEIPIPGTDGYYEVVTSAVLTSTASGSPLNSNSGFESGTSSWTGSGGTLSVDAVVFHTGAQSGKIVPDGTTAEVRIDSDPVPVTEGSTYSASGYVYCAVARTVRVTVHWFDDLGGLISESVGSASVPAFTWTRISNLFIAPAGAETANITASMTGTPEVSHTLWADELVLSATEGAQIFNAGDVPTYPLWVFWGPFTSIEGHNVVSDERWSITYTAADSTNKLYLNTDPGNSYLVDEHGVNQWDALDAGHNLWPLRKGDNIVNITFGDVTEDSLAIMTYEPLYEGD